MEESASALEQQDPVAYQQEHEYGAKDTAGPGKAFRILQEPTRNMANRLLRESRTRSALDEASMGESRKRKRRKRTKRIHMDLQMSSSDIEQRKILDVRDLRGPG